MQGSGGSNSGEERRLHEDGRPETKPKKANLDVKGRYEQQVEENTRRCVLTDCQATSMGGARCRIITQLPPCYRRDGTGSPTQVDSTKAAALCAVSPCKHRSAVPKTHAHCIEKSQLGRNLRMLSSYSRYEAFCVLPPTPSQPFPITSTFHCTISPIIGPLRDTATRTTLSDRLFGRLFVLVGAVAYVHRSRLNKILREEAAARSPPWLSNSLPNTTTGQLYLKER